MIPREYLKKIRAIEIRTNRLAQELLTGAYQSAFKGRGMDFEEVREYQAGDDVRTIDWNVTARTGITHIKKFREERPGQRLGEEESRGVERAGKKFFPPRGKIGGA